MSHGGNIKALRDLAGRDVIDFSASINPLGAPNWLRAEVSRNLSETAHYPDIDSTDFRQAVAKSFQVDESEVTPANGTTELIFTLPRILNIKRAVIAEPCYIDYRIACEKECLEIVSLPLHVEDNFELNYSELESLLNSPSIVFLAHPNNPTGKLLNISEMNIIIAKHPECTFIIDEAYLSFAPLQSSKASFTELIKEYNNLIVLRSLTKFYALAGLRLGVAFACKDLTKLMRDSLPPWSVNTLSQKIGTRAVLDSDYARETSEFVEACRNDLISSLKSFPELTVFKTYSNFILCRVSSMTSTELFSRLIKHGIAIRDCSNFKHLDNTYFRVAVRTNPDNNKLSCALSEVFGTKYIYSKTNFIKKKTPSLMMLGCSSNAGKSIIVSALCRILLQDGIKVAPFKSQNMALNSFVTKNGLEMGRAQAVQAQASNLEADIRMNPILLKPNSDTGSQVIVMGKPVGNMRVHEYIKFKETAFNYAKDAYDSLSSDYDAIILEGAGSPGEVNLKKHDIVNTRMAEYAESPSILVGDIDRGGIYASFIGMYETFEEWERQLVKGFLVNRFRGDASLLEDAHKYVKDFTGRDVIGVVPYLHDLGLPEEDSVSFKDNFLPKSGKDANPLDIALIALPHVSNFTDFDPLTNEPDVILRLVRTTSDLGTPDCIMLPGSKNVIGDLKFLDESGLANKIIELSKKRVIVGICGGFQILGKALSDPHNIEGGGSVSGLSLIPIETTLAQDKTLVRAEAVHKTSGYIVRGYEIHHGETKLFDSPKLFIRSDGEAIGAGDENIWGTYLHGVFDADEFRRYFINTLHKSLDREYTDSIRYSYDLEPAFDRLAQTVRESVDMDKIYQMMGI